MSASGWMRLSPALLTSTSTGPSRFGGRLDELTGGLRAAQVGADRDRRAACRGDLRRQCLGGLAVGAVAERQRCPASGQPGRRGLSDAAAGTGDEHNPATE